ncbi:unnamed protein product [Penicillium nalgiovense]|nr:unnamed protein product [Penicillium nalgiovense]
MSLQIVAVKEDVGFNRPQLRNVSFNTSNQVGDIHRGPANQTVPVKVSMRRRLCEEVSAIASWSTVAALVDHRFEVQLLTLQIRDVRTQCTRARATASCGLFVPGLDHQKIEPLGAHQSGPDNPALPGTPSSTVKYTVASGIFRQIEDKTKVAADERPQRATVRVTIEHISMPVRITLIVHYDTSAWCNPLINKFEYCSNPGESVGIDCRCITRMTLYLNGDLECMVRNSW